MSELNAHADWEQAANEVAEAMNTPLKDLQKMADDLNAELDQRLHEFNKD